MNMIINTNYSQDYKITGHIKERIEEKSRQEADTTQSGKDAAIVEISKMGLQQYKENIKPQQGIIMTDFNSLIGSRMPSIYGEMNEKGEYERNYYSVSETSSDLLKTYAGLYDEIVRGHEDGSRTTYIEDKTSEGGYRKLTMDEELNELDKAYKNYADRYAAKHDKHIMDIISAHAKKVSSISDGRTSIANEANDLLEKYKNDPVPEDFSSRMMKAKNSFVVQYKANRGMDINSLLSGISIFTKN